MYTDKYSREQYSQSDINYNLIKSKKQKKLEFIEEHGTLFCNKCKSEFENGEQIDFNTIERQAFQAAHIKSIKKCKEDSEIEWIWHKDNMEYECYFHHELRDGRNLQFNINQ